MIIHITMSHYILADQIFIFKSTLFSQPTAPIVSPTALSLSILCPVVAFHPYQPLCLLLHQLLLLLLSRFSGVRLWATP